MKKEAQPLRLFLLLGVTCVLACAASTFGALTTNFAKDATLTPEQVKSVVELVRECGLAEPTILATYRTKPLGRRVISVRGAEQVNGKRSSYEEVIIYYSGWEKFYMQGTPKQRDGFYVYPPFVAKRHSAEIVVEGKSFGVRISEDVTTEIAERVFGAFASGNVQFQRKEDEYAHQMLGKDVKSWVPASIIRDKKQKEYEISFGKSPRVARVNLVDTKVIVTFGPEGVVY